MEKIQKGIDRKILKLYDLSKVWWSPREDKDRVFFTDKFAIKLLVE